MKKRKKGTAETKRLQTPTMTLGVNVNDAREERNEEMKERTTTTTKSWTQRQNDEARPDLVGFRC